jgi:hypothetical protein
VRPEPDARRCGNRPTGREEKDRKPKIRTTASGGGSSNMNCNSHGSPEEERRGGRGKEGTVGKRTQLARRSTGGEVTGAEQSSGGEMWCD